MIKKLFNSFALLVKSGVLFHRSTVIGILCGSWVYFGAEDEGMSFSRLLTLDLYLFMFAFLLMYRLMFKKVNDDRGDPDFKAMGIYLLGDFAWAVIAMVCSVPFFLMFNFSDVGDLTERRKMFQTHQMIQQQLPKFNQLPK